MAIAQWAGRGLDVGEPRDRDAGRATLRTSVTQTGSMFVDVWVFSRCHWDWTRQMYVRQMCMSQTCVGLGPSQMVGACDVIKVMPI